MKTLLTRMTNVLVAASAVTVLFAQPAEPDADWRAFFGTLHAHSGVSDGVERPNVAFSDEISDASSPPPPKWATYQPSGFGFGVQGGAVSQRTRGLLSLKHCPTCLTLIRSSRFASITMLIP